jgi:hypothetical protein
MFKKPSKMKLKNILSQTFLLLVISLSVINCAEETILYEEPALLKSEEFTFIPVSPKTGQQVSMVYYGCEYYETSSLTFESKNILVKKHFNGSMKRPCILAHDTISFGILDPGNYLVTLEIIDINPFAPDSLFHTETKTLVVIN